MSTPMMRAAIEAILFAAGDAVETSRIAMAIEADQKETLACLSEMQTIYEKEDHGIFLVELENAWQLCTKNEYYDALIRLEINARKPKLTEVLMETLAIIAYKQPVTRMEIEKIRGVNCDHAVNRLIEFDLIREVGRMDAPGRPILLGTTESFLRYFGMKTPEELPDMDPIKIVDFQSEAEQEAGFAEGEFAALQEENAAVVEDATEESAETDVNEKLYTDLGNISE